MKKDKTIIKMLWICLALTFVLAIYQSVLIIKLSENLRMVAIDRDRVVELYNSRN